MPSPERDNRNIAIPPMSCEHETHNYLMKLYILQLEDKELPSSKEIYDHICYLLGSNSKLYNIPRFHGKYNIPYKKGKLSEL